MPERLALRVLLVLSNPGVSRNRFVYRCRVLAYRVELHRVLSEDPWRSEVIESRVFSDWESARRFFLDKLSRLEAGGYECSDHASAWAQLCTRTVEAGAERDPSLGIEVPVIRSETMYLVLLPVDEGGDYRW